MEFQRDTLIKFLIEAHKTTPGEGVSTIGDDSKGTYKGLKYKASLGAGRASLVPWITFTGFNQSTKNGIYPALLYYKTANTLILAYCVSSDQRPSFSWSKSLEKFPTIEEYFRANDLDTHGKYLDSQVYKAYSLQFDENGKLIENTVSVDKILQDLSTLVEEYTGLFGGNSVTITGVGDSDENLYVNQNRGVPVLFDISKICNAIANTGLIYDNNLIKRYLCALLTKPFVILSGLAGSGKTQLALAVAHALCEDIDNQLCFVAVGADWTNREPLLGYPNALKADEYVRPENGALDIIIRASQDSNHPYFLVLDEMNLSYVERYFADFLSAMESHTDIALWTGEGGDVPHSVKLPSNLFIIGTINVDETTYMFSPKVLDRASVIEFKIQPSEMSFYLNNSKPVDIKKANGAAASMANEFLSRAANKNLKKEANTIETLMKFFTELKAVNAEFGYRSASEIFRYLSHADYLGMTANEAIDSAIVQKLLPKVHGSKKHVGPTLSKLWNLCLAQPDSDPLKETTDVDAANLRYPLAADKIARMYKAACNNGFTSFAEA